MERILFILVLLLGTSVVAQQEGDPKITEIKTFQQEQNEHYKDKKHSPLTKKERRAFEGHRFYPINLDYRGEAKFEYIEQEDTIVMQTSSGREKYYRPYAYVHFKINGDSCKLTVYQSYRLRETKEYKDYLFIPFRDATSGKTSYGGGRYLDILIPEGNTVILNFNLAYNPYCAYTMGYNCTIPPAENTLNVAIRAGLMAPEVHDEDH
ncbi:MAG: DUF1684 domain-containing protein [Crocinitomicaceae bacterium]